ncbi:MAG: Hpt domain-containing protein [Thermodesulfobacteriota bacterium]
MMDDESLQMYFEESKEHLEDIESNLLQMEQDGANVDTELVNKVFRAAHSMKGGAGFLGLDNIKELAHKIENVLDMVRNEELVPGSEVVNVVLSAFDRLNELVDNMSESNEMDISEHIVALQGVKSANLEEEDKKSIEERVQIKHPDGRVIFTPTTFDIAQGLKGATQLYLVEYDLIHDVHRQDKKPMDVIKMLGQSGTIVDLAVDLHAVGTLDQEEIASSLPMYVLYSVVLEPDLMPTLLGVEQDKVIHLAENKSDLLQSPSSQEAVEEASGARTKEAATQEAAAENAPGQEISTEPEESQEPQKSPASDKGADPASKPQVEKAVTARAEPSSQAESGRQDQEGKDVKPGQEGKDQKSAAKQSSQDKSASAQSETLRVNVNVLD